MAAPELLTRLLVGTGKIDRLTDVLSRAADSARSPERQAALWLIVAAVYANHNNVGAAIASLKRALKVDPEHVEAQRMLARTYLQNAQWPEAIAACDNLIKLGLETSERAEILVEMAALLDERLGNRGRARAVLTSALELVPGHLGALCALGKMQLRAGEIDAAEATTRELLTNAPQDSDRVPALVLLALLERERGNLANVERALSEAVTIDGASGEAAALFHKFATSGSRVMAFVAALDAHLRRPGPSEDKVACYLTLATLNAERMNLARKAVEVLEAGLVATGGDLKLVEALVVRARAAGQLEVAGRSLHAALQRQERQPELWRSLSHVYKEMGRPVEARLAASAVAALGAATAEDHNILRQSPARPGSAPNDALGPEQLAALAAEAATAHAAASVVAACAESLGKIAPTDLAAMGLSRKDRLAPGADHPVRQLIDRLSEVIGVKCDAYEHPRLTPLVTVALTEPVCLIVSARLASLPEAQQVFLLARALAAVAVNLHPVLVLPAPDLQRLVDGGTDVIVPGFAGRNPQAEDTGQRIKKTISRRWRKLLETAAPAYAAAPLANLQAWQLLTIRLFDRAAALLADDSAAVVAALPLAAGPGTTAPDAASVRVEVSALLRFWMSPPAMQFRAGASAMPSAG